MTPLLSSTSYLPLRPPLYRSRIYLPLQLRQTCFSRCHLNGFKNLSALAKFPLMSLSPIGNRHLTVRAVAPADEGAVSLMNFEDLDEKDWSFLEDDSNTEDQNNPNADRIILAGEIRETSRVLISIGAEGFVDRVVNSCSFKQLLIVHDSLLVLACIKEKYDFVKCWQGELVSLPEKWAPFDVVFLYYFPALSFQLSQVLEALSKYCMPGARIVISHPQGREMAEEQHKQYPMVVVSKLPDEMTLQTVAADYLFTLDKYIDEPGFYLAVLKFKANES